MNTLSPGNGEMKGPPPITQYNQKNNSTGGRMGILQWWYKITSPPEPGASTSFQERELFRRGRTGSQVSITLFLLLFVSLPAALAGSNTFLIIILIFNFLALVVGLILNRLKRVSLAGVLVVLSVLAGPTANILTTPGGTNTSALPIFGLLVLPLMCAVSFLPPAWVFVVAAWNCLFTLYVLSVLPSTGELHQVLKTAFPGVVTPIILSQVIVSIVAFLWVRGARLALLRADRAEEIAALEQREIERQQVQLEQKQQLDKDIQLILQTHVAVANGNFGVRAPLGKENVLWQVAYSLNNLLARLQGYNQMRGHYQQLQEENYKLHEALRSTSSTQNELQHTKEAVMRLVESLKISKGGRIPAIPWRSGTVIDSLVAELNTYTHQTKELSGKKQDVQ